MSPLQLARFNSSKLRTRHFGDAVSISARAITERCELSQGPWLLAEPVLCPAPRAVTRGRPWHHRQALLDGELQFLRTEVQRRKTPGKCSLLRACHRLLQKWIHTGRLMRRGCFRNEQAQPGKPCVDATLVIALYLTILCRKTMPSKDRPLYRSFQQTLSLSGLLRLELLARYFAKRNLQSV